MSSVVWHVVTIIKIICVLLEGEWPYMAVPLILSCRHNGCPLLCRCCIHVMQIRLMSHLQYIKTAAVYDIIQ